MPQMALSKDFLEAYSRLPKAQQKKVREFTEKFRRDPTQTGINFERLKDSRDDKVRSVRIDQAYRAIVVHPPKGDVYLCVWVDHHDAAYDWARNRVFEVNPTSGALQLYEVTESSPAAEPTVAAPAAPKVLFESLDDEDLLLAGVPGALLPSVRALQAEADLDALATHLPEEAAEMLYLMAAGYGLMEAIEETERAREKAPKVDVEDFQTALSKSESQRQFKLIDDEHELNDILDAPFDQWRIFLHPTQRKLVQMKANGPVRVLGGAGTGKTVVLMHRARHLARDVFTGADDRLLVTTYTRNLALDLKMQLRKLCGRDFPRVEVLNLHSWAIRFMRKQGAKFQLVPEPERNRLWEMAFAEFDDRDHDLSFYLDEWNQVVQPQDVSTRDDYFAARRVGRGVRLSRRQRAAAWKVFERYRQLLDDAHFVEWEDVIRETRLFIEKQGVTFPYRAVLADEAQDLSPNDLKLLRALVPKGPNDMFLVGDGHQRIYARETRLGRCGIEIRGRSRRLKLNYRTTEEIRNHAVAILEGCSVDDLNEGLDSLKGYKSLRKGPEPDLKQFERESQEADFVVVTLRSWLADVAPETICVAARTSAQIRDRYLPLLEGAEIPSVVVEKDPESESHQAGVRLATMHRLKGLEFKRVLLVGVNDTTAPLQKTTGTSVGSTEHDQRERCLFYVAMSRARDRLGISGYGDPSRFCHPDDYE